MRSGGSCVVCGVAVLSTLAGFSSLLWAAAAASSRLAHRYQLLRWRISCREGSGFLHAQLEERRSSGVGVRHNDVIVCIGDRRDGHIEAVGARAAPAAGGGAGQAARGWGAWGSW